MLEMRHKEAESFEEFSNQLEHINIILRGTSYYLNNVELIKQATLAANTNLHCIIKESQIQLTLLVKFCTWHNVIYTFNEKQLANREMIQCLLNCHSNKGNSKASNGQSAQSTFTFTTTSNLLPNWQSLNTYSLRLIMVVLNTVTSILDIVKNIVTTDVTLQYSLITMRR